MFRRVFLAAILAGALAGLVTTGLQAAKLWPLIAAAETYEAPDHDGSGWAPASGIERSAATFLANLLIGIGFGLLLTGSFALRHTLADRPTGATEGLLWGAAGFACFALAPALGLPPELPGSPAADLAARQAWWLGTALATGGGIGLLVFAARLPWRLVGVALLLLPHLVGAPHPPTSAFGTAPAPLAAAFAAASLVTAAVFWLVLGGASGWLYARLGARR